MDKKFLTYRTHAVLVDGNISDYINVNSGVPQGSVLEPRLFRYYINDTPIGLKFTLRLFADDIISYMTVSNTPSAETVQADLDKLATWEQISISRKRKPVKFNYTLHGRIFESVSVVKKLGCNITRDLK